MAKAAQDGRLAVEALHIGRLNGKVPGKDLESHMAVVADLACAIDSAHTAGPNFSEDLKVTHGQAKVGPDPDAFRGQRTAAFFRGGFDRLLKDVVRGG
jgi:hypothetical protein